MTNKKKLSPLAEFDRVAREQNKTYAEAQREETRKQVQFIKTSEIRGST